MAYLVLHYTKMSLPSKQYYRTKTTMQNRNLEYILNNINTKHWNTAPCQEKLLQPSNGCESFEEIMREKQGGVELEMTLLREIGIHSSSELEKKQLQWFHHVKIILF